MSWDYGSRPAMLLERHPWDRFNADMDILARAIADFIRAVTFQQRHEEPRANRADTSQETRAQANKPLVSKHARRAMTAQPDET
jgi:hypothetical protein